MLQRYPYQCECGWNTEYLTGGFRRVIPLAERIENQLVRSKNLDAKKVWRSLYYKAVSGEIVSDSIKVREGNVSCFHCQSSLNQIALYDSSNQLIHPILCNECGKEGHFSSPPEPTKCPFCQEEVVIGELFSIQEQINRMLQRCQLTFQHHLQTSGPLIIVLGERSNKDLKPYLSQTPFISIEEGTNHEREMDLLQLLSNQNRVFLHTYFETPIVTRLTLLLVKHLFELNIEVIPIIAAPPTIVGKRRIEKFMGYIHELQYYSPQTVLVSSSIRKEFGSVMGVFEEHVPRQITEVMSLYSKE
jgi:uncharacterized CHY-type Zn-finger protein